MYQVLYSLKLLSVRQGEGTVTAKEVEKVGWLWNIESDVVPIVKVLVSILLSEGNGGQFVSLLHEVLMGQEV